MTWNSLQPVKLNIHIGTVGFQYKIIQFIALPI